MVTCGEGERRDQLSFMRKNLVLGVPFEKREFKKHTAEGGILVGIVGALRVAVTDVAWVDAAAVHALELADGADTRRAGLWFVRAVAAVRLAVAFPPDRDAPVADVRSQGQRRCVSDGASCRKAEDKQLSGHKNVFFFSG